MRIDWLGRIAYPEATALQHDAVAEVLDGGEERIYLLEHPPTITVGRHGGEEYLHARPETLAAENIHYAQSERGGLVTCHFPGQLVVYPILKLARRGGVKAHIRMLEELAIRLAARYGVIAARKEGEPGVFTAPERKLASVGVAARRFVSYHGLAVNIAADVSLFSRVTPCGLAGVSATAIALESETPPSFETARQVATEILHELLQA